MSASKSDLASTKYGYDFVVATTQAAINATMKEYMSGLTEPEVIVCYTADTNGNPTQIDYNTLVANANGTDPFSIPDGTSATNQDVLNLYGARFMFAFKARIGLPPGILPQNMPDIVALQGGTSAVKYNLMCSEFIITQYTPASGYTAASWMNQSQPSGTAWLFTSNVDLRLTTMDSTAYSTLPQDVQNQIKNIGGNAFSVQQLLFDLNNAALETQPTISGVTPGTSLYTALSNDFLGAYYTTMKANGQPMLSASITQTNSDPATLTLTDLNLEVNPFLGSSGSAVTNPTQAQADLDTLDYLCAANGNTLPVATQFGWNWIDESEASDYQGVIAIKSSTFIDWLNNLLLPDLNDICKQPTCDCHASGFNMYYSLGFNDVTTAQTFTVVSDATADSDGFVNVLTFSYSASCSSNGGTEGLVWGNLKCDYSSSCNVYFSTTQIKIESYVNAWIHVNVEGGVTEGNFATYNSTTIYDLSATSSGKLVATTTGATLVDNSQTIDTNGWSQFVSLGTVDNVINSEKSYTQQILSSFLDSFGSDISACLNGPLAWIFPGGQTFTFKKVLFSDDLDLVSYITYADPTGPQNLLSANSNDASSNDASSSNTITYSSELMQNYKQAEVMSPEENFEALQTSAGNSLLFSVGTDGVFYVTQEIPGHNTGWEKTDLSSILVAQDFAGKTATCKRFDVAQNAADGSIGSAMVIQDSDNDNLYLMLEQSAQNTAWLDDPAWVSYPYDNPDHTLSAIKIVNVFMAETSGQVQYIVVDVLRDPGNQTQQLISRYYIDSEKTDGYAWHAHDVSIDLEATEYSSCLGQKKGQYVDGLYTFGEVGGNAQFIYQPLYNVWNPAIPASASRLNLPGNRIPDAMAACRNSDNTTDLYVTANGSLYYFSSANQSDGATAQLLFANSVFSDVRKLYAFSSGGDIIIWGLNGADEIFYTSCAVGSVACASASAWSYPLPILNKVDLVSPYVNRVNNGNTFFAVANNELTKAVQTPDKTVWQSQKITLPTLKTANAQKFNSYTTQIQVSGANDQPVVNTPVSLSSLARTNVYINHLYYILDTTPIEVETDTLGQITIVQWVDGLQGSQIIVTGSDGTQIQINPMQKPFNKVASLNTSDSLKAATITSSDGSTKPLVSSDTSDNDLQTVANGNTSLAAAYSNVAAPGSSNALRLAQAVPATVMLAADNGIEVAASDLFNWLASGVESVIEIVEDAASGAWHFIATIGGQAYRCVLDSVEAVVGAVEWVFNAIETAIEDLIKYLEFLFGWNDITRTKEVLKNLTQLFVQDQLDNIKALETLLDGKIDDLEASINAWAGITDWSGLGQAASQPASGSSTPSSGSSSSSSFMSHHFQGNAGNVVQTNPPSTPDPTQQLVNDLLQVIENEATVISNVLTQLANLANEVPTLSFSEVLKKLMAILADGVLDTIKNVMNALFNILYDIASIAFEVMDTPIYIPVISDILKDIGVPDLSMLDLFCWLTAVPVTIMYKIAKGEAPFPDNSNTDFLITATSYEDVVNAFQPAQSNLLVNSGNTSGNSATLGEMPAATSMGVFMLGHAGSGILTLMAAIVNSLEAAEESGDNEFAIPSALLGIVGGAAGGVVNVLVPKDPLQNEAASDVNKVTLAVRILSKLTFSGPGQKYFASSTKLSFMKADDGRATGAVVDAILTFPALICTCTHLSELSAMSANAERSQAIIEETANVVSYLSRISYAIAVNTDDPEDKAADIGVMAVSDVCYSGLEIAEAFIA